MGESKECKEIILDDGEVYIRITPEHIIIWTCPQSTEAQENTKEDLIRHPNHYTWRGTEAIDIVRAMTRGSEGVEAYLLGCTVKYMYRFPKKNGAQDLEKAVQCLKMLREYLYGPAAPAQKKEG